jgi:cysteine desulfurase
VGRDYLDHASTSPLRPAARDAMVEVLHAASAGAIGDPARIHIEGLAARDLLEGAREQVAGWLGVRARQVVLTSGATESIAAAVFGARTRDADRQDVVSSAVEHSAVRTWSSRGPCREVVVDDRGRVDPESVRRALGTGTALVNLQWANHEVATRQPVGEVVEICGAAGVLLHVDAAQAITEAPEAACSGADLVSISGHKLGGPSGTGVLVVGRGLRVPPLMVGGDQERARRAGLENLAGAVGLGAAAAELATSGGAEHDRVRHLGDRIRAWTSGRDDVHLLGDPELAVGHLVCLGLEGVEPQPVLLGLDQRGVAAHSGSSCSSEAFEPSPVLEAMGADAQRSLRLSVGWSTRPEEVERALGALEEVLDDLHRLRGGR